MAVHSLRGWEYNLPREVPEAMATEKTPHVTERESLKVAEASRQAEWE
jgi:hypothetical protein